MKIAICDDEIKYVEETKIKVKNILAEQNINAEIDLYNSSTAIYNCGKFYDIAFLDIEMEPYSGIKVAEKLKATNPYIVIFIVTSYDEYLDDAMDLNVFRYIKKPLDERRLKSGVCKALEMIDNNVITFFLKSGNNSVNQFIIDAIKSAIAYEEKQTADDELLDKFREILKEELTNISVVTSASPSSAGIDMELTEEGYLRGRLN